MKTLIKHSLFTCIALLLFNFSYAQDFEFTAATSHQAVKTGDRFQIEFKGNGDFTNFKAPSFSNFRVLSGPNQSTSMSWINGRTSSSVSYSYILMAVKEGEFTIGPAVAAFEGKAYKTNTLKINVTKGVPVQQNTGGNQQNTTTQQANVSDDLYIKASVNKTKVYQGEQIIATYKLYTRVNISGNELVKNADLNGFWSQEIDIGQSQWTQEIIGGYRWQVATIRKIVLFPQRSGKLEIDPLAMNFTVQRRASGRGQSVFDQFFGRYENVEYQLKSEAIKINVMPHPQPAPEGFNGAVGNMDMVVDVSANEVKANEAINIKVKISGKGNINLIEKPTIKFPSDFETYDPKVNDNIKTTINGVAGNIEYDYLIIPRHAGKFNIDPIVFSYFDPTTKKYKTITSDPIQLNILKGDGTSNNVAFSSSNKEDIELLGEDIRYIHTLPIEIAHANTQFYNSWKFYLSLLLAPLLFLLTFIFRNKIRTANSDVVGMKKKKASKLATKRLASAKASLAANNKSEFYEATSKALYGYVGDKLNIAVSELNQSNIKEKLTAINVTENTVTDLIETLELCDMARFAPVAVAEQEVYDKAASIINKIEDEVA
ncbi:MAG: protein BatD [Vicingus serpentipes]|nr:protein BatD [Vicingus serpentipes]